MAYVYRFKDIYDNVIYWYIGYTGQTLNERMNQHFTKGHLSQECYSSVAKIEYQQYKTKADAQIIETIMINKYKPRFNKLNKQTDNITFDLGDEREWKIYRVFKVKEDTYKGNNKRFSIFTVTVTIVYVLLILAYFFF